MLFKDHLDACRDLKAFAALVVPESGDKIRCQIGCLGGRSYRRIDGPGKVKLNDIIKNFARLQKLSGAEDEKYIVAIQEAISQLDQAGNELLKRKSCIVRKFTSLRQALGNKGFNRTDVLAQISSVTKERAATKQQTEQAKLLAEQAKQHEEKAKPRPVPVVPAGSPAAPAALPVPQAASAKQEDEQKLKQAVVSGPGKKNIGKLEENLRKEKEAAAKEKETKLKKDAERRKEQQQKAEERRKAEEELKKKEESQVKAAEEPHVKVNEERLNLEKIRISMLSNANLLKEYPLLNGLKAIDDAFGSTSKRRAFIGDEFMNRINALFQDLPQGSRLAITTYDQRMLEEKAGAFAELEGQKVIELVQLIAKRSTHPLILTLQMMRAFTTNLMWKNLTKNEDMSTHLIAKAQESITVEKVKDEFKIWINFEILMSKHSYKLAIMDIVSLLVGLTMVAIDNAKKLTIQNEYRLRQDSSPIIKFSIEVVPPSKRVIYDKEFLKLLIASLAKEAQANPPMKLG